MIYDFAIVGGGPAGTAAGITLCRHSSSRVVLIEASNTGSPSRVGETVSPALLPLLKYLEVDQDFHNDHHLPSYGNTAAWGSPDIVENESILTGRGNGWHLDRTKFDNMLLRKFANLGGEVNSGCRLRKADFNNDHWDISFVDDERNERKIAAKMVIDASGRKAFFAKQQNVKRVSVDRLTAVIGYFKLNESAPQRIFLEAAEYGWWYSAPLPNNKLVVNLMTDIDILRAHKLNEPENWIDALNQTKHIGNLVKSSAFIPGIQVRPAHSHILEKVYDTRWIATGDAACSFDPISSLGIGHAISSGIHAARCANQLLDDSDELAEAYAMGIVENMRQYISIKKAFYSKERRWPDAPFWRRRAAVVPA